MVFTPINMGQRERKEYFEQFYSNVPTTFSITVNLDISNLRNKSLKLYPAMLYLLARLVNKHEEFRTMFDDDGILGFFDIVHPVYTIFHKETETFSGIWSEYDPDFETFCRNYNSDVNKYGNIMKYEAKPNCPPNIFYVSMLPWLHFSSFNLNLKQGYDYLMPIFTMGKYIEENGKTILPFSVLAHHAVCDGWHVSKFINELQQNIDNL